jgi:hypothetical protein
MGRIAYGIVIDFRNSLEIGNGHIEIGSCAFESFHDLLPHARLFFLLKLKTVPQPEGFQSFIAIGQVRI